MTFILRDLINEQGETHEIKRNKFSKDEDTRMKVYRVIPEEAELSSITTNVGLDNDVPAMSIVLIANNYFMLECSKNNILLTVSKSKRELKEDFFKRNETNNSKTCIFQSNLVRDKVAVEKFFDFLWDESKRRYENNSEFALDLA